MICATSATACDRLEGGDSGTTSFSFEIDGSLRGGEGLKQLSERVDGARHDRHPLKRKSSHGSRGDSGRSGMRGQGANSEVVALSVVDDSPSTR